MRGITELNHRLKVRFSTLLLPLCAMAAAPPVCYALCKVEHIGSKQSQSRKGSTVHTSLSKMIYDLCPWRGGRSMCSEMVIFLLPEISQEQLSVSSQMTEICIYMCVQSSCRERASQSP